jgi:hypothetical protein
MATGFFLLMTAAITTALVVGARPHRARNLLTIYDCAGPDRGLDIVSQGDVTP